MIFEYQAELADITSVARDPETDNEDRERAFTRSVPYRDGMISAGKFSGTTSWERHPVGDEIVMILVGPVVIEIERKFRRVMQSGGLIVIPKIPGLALGLAAWVLNKAIPHVAGAVVKDRENKRKHLIAMRKLEASLNDRPKKLL